MSRSRDTAVPVSSVAENDAKRAGNEAPMADVYTQRFSVPFEYSVVFTEDVFARENPALRDVLVAREPERRHRVLVVVDGGVAAAWPSLASDIDTYTQHCAVSLELVAPLLVVPGGEVAKNDPAILAHVQNALHKAKMDRHSFVVAVGGGAVLDMVGFAAATTHRGVRHVRVPTTVLAQNDSGVGVKNAVNAFGAKNFLGTFVPPYAVINDARFIETLSARDRVAGMAEAVKVAVIRDVSFFEWLEANAGLLARFEPGAMKTMIRRAAELHLRHIATSGDPFEFGSARPLDFGHWSAHKLENMSSHALRHGEAVAIGMALDTRYSFEMGLLGERDMERMIGVLDRLGFTLSSGWLAERNADGSLRVLEGLDEFREHLGGDLTVTLLAGLGKGVEVNEIDAATVARCIDWLAERRSGTEP